MSDSDGVAQAGVGLTAGVDDPVQERDAHAGKTEFAAVMIGVITPQLLGASANGTSDDRPSFVSLMTKSANTYVPPGKYWLDSDLAWAGKDGSLSISPFANFSGGTLNLTGLVPRQSNPIFSLNAARKTYGSEFPSSKYINIYQFAQTAIRTISGKAVAIYGLGEGAANNATGWGANFVGYGSVANATGVGIEVNCGALVEGAIGYGVVVATVGMETQSAFQAQSNGKSTIANAFLIETNSVTYAAFRAKTQSSCQFGLKLSGVYTTAEVDVPSFCVSKTSPNLTCRLEIGGGTAASPSPEIRARSVDGANTANAGLKYRAIGLGEHEFYTDDTARRLHVTPSGIGFNGRAAAVPPTLPADLPTDGTATNIAIAEAINALMGMARTNGLAN